MRACATLGLSWPQLRRQMPPHRTKLRMLSPTCLQTCANCAIFDTSWAQVGPLSWAPRMARFDPSRLWLAKYARSFPLYPILGAGGSRREATRIYSMFQVRAPPPPPPPWSWFSLPPCGCGCCRYCMVAPPPLWMWVPPVDVSPVRSVWFAPLPLWMWVLFAPYTK